MYKCLSIYAMGDMRTKAHTAYNHYNGTCLNRNEIDSPLCVRRMASAKIGATSIVSILLYTIKIIC